MKGWAAKAACLREAHFSHFPSTIAAPLLGNCRVGEAAPPGPVDAEPATNQWCLGTINPTGLSGKAKTCDQLQAGICAVSESHLSTRGIPRFAAELKSCQNKFRFYPGPPALTQSNSVFAAAGKQTGVGFLSSVPTRPLNFGWNHELFATARVHAATRRPSMDRWSSRLWSVH